MIWIVASSVEKVRCSLGFRGQIRPQPRLVAPGSLQSIWLTTRGVARGLARGEKAQTVPTAFHEPMKVCSFRQMCTVNPPLWILFCCMLKKKPPAQTFLQTFFKQAWNFSKRKTFHQTKYIKCTLVLLDSASPISGIGCGRKRQSHLWRARETRKLGLPGGEQFGGRCGWKTSGEFSHLGCIKPCKSWDRLPTSTAWCKVSSIHRIKMWKELPFFFPKPWTFGSLKTWKFLGCMLWVLFFPAALLNSGFASCWIAWVFTMKWGCRIVESSNCRVVGSKLRDLNNRPDSEEPLVAADGEWFPLFQASWSWRIHKLRGFDRLIW